MGNRLVVKDVQIQHPAALPGREQEWKPDDPESFQVLVGIWIGPRDEDEPDYHPGVNERYDVWVCTPRFLSQYPASRGIVWGRHRLILLRWDYTLLRDALDDLCAQASVLESSQCYEYLGQFLEWESETRFESVRLARDPLTESFVHFFEDAGRADLLFHSPAIRELTDRLQGRTLSYLLFVGLEDPLVQRFWLEIPDRHWRELPLAPQTGRNPLLERARDFASAAERERILKDPGVRSFFKALEESLATGS